MLPSDQSFELLLNKIKSMINENADIEAIINEPSLYIHNIKHPDFVTPDKLRFIVNLVKNNPEAQLDEIKICLDDFNVIVTHQIIVSDVNTAAMYKNTAISAIFEIISQHHILIGIPEKVKVLMHNSDLNDIESSDETESISFSYLIELKSSLDYSLFVEKYQKYNYFCGRLIMNPSSDDYIDYNVIVSNVRQRVPFPVKLKSLGTSLTKQHENVIDVLKDIKMKALPLRDLLRLYAVLLSTNYHVYIDLLLDTIRLASHRFRPSSGNIIIEWRDQQSDLKYIPCTHIQDLSDALKPSETTIDDLEKFIEKYGVLFGSSYFCNQCGEDLSSIFCITDNSVRVLDKKLMGSSITNIFNHEPYKSYSSSFGYVMMVLGSLATLINVNTRSVGYATTKYILDWLMVTNRNIREYETKYKLEISKGVFFARLNQDLFSLNFSEKERFGEIKQLNLRVLIIVGMLLSTTESLTYSLLSTLKLKDTNILELALKLLTRLKYSHENIQLIVEFYLRPTIVLDSKRLSTVKKQVELLSRMLVIKPKMVELRPILLGKEVVSEEIVSLDVSPSKKIYFLTNQRISLDNNGPTRQLIMPTISVKEALMKVEKYSSLVTFNIQYKINNDYKFVDSYSLSEEDGVEFISLRIESQTILFRVDQLIKTDFFKISGNEYFNMLRMGDLCPYSTKVYLYNVQSRYHAVENLCSRYVDNVDFEQIRLKLAGLDMMTKLMAFNIMCMSLLTQLNTPALMAIKTPKA
jgi:hypothetical protein